MPHTTRHSYKDKAMAAGTYRNALTKALAAIDGLTIELRQRDERETELVEVSATLAKSCLRLSGTLRHGVGDFGVDDYTPDTQVDIDLKYSRPAMIMLRCNFLMEMSVQRLEKLHLESELGEEAGKDVLDSLQHLEEVARISQARRRALLITGISTTKDDMKHLDETEHEYSYDKAGLSLADLYEVSSMEVECGHTTGTTITSREYLHIAEKCSEKHHRLIN
jgi:hypothetical protein